MKKLFKIDAGNDYSINKRVVNFLNPEYVCVFFNNPEILGILKNVLKNRVIEPDNIFSHSSVSGSIAGVVDICVDNIDKKAIFLKNDFKEKDVRKTVKKIGSCDELVYMLKGSPYQDLFVHKNIKNIVVNGIKDEPLVTTESYILKNRSDEIIETISYLDEIYNFDKSFIVLKNSENDNISEYLSKSGSYPNMNVLALENKYLIGRSEFLLNKIKVSKEESIIITPSELMEIRSIFKKNVLASEKYISVIDVESKKIRFVYVKKNVLVSEVLNKLKLLKTDRKFLKNGLINGTLINPNKEVITADVDAIFIIKEEKIISKKCINCGKCVSVCPAGLNPKKNFDKKYIDPKCINCGSCSFFCPSNVKFYRNRDGGKK
ncbi:MAG: 4Fe-4S binding protein [bacterium]